MSDSSTCDMVDAVTCTYENLESGQKYVEFSCLYPKSLEWSYLQYEKCFHANYWVEWSRENPMVPIVAVILYATIIYTSYQYMKDKKPFNWKRAMALWNLGLSVFSFMCMIRSIPHLFHIMFTEGPRDLVCVKPTETYGHGSTGLWITLFVYSKIVEFGDTVFIVAHKKPLIFLHYWHHITVLLYSWFAFVRDVPSSVIFMAVNSTVHFIMYGYYFLMTIKMKPKWMNPFYITVFQLAQMVLGLFVTFSSLAAFNYQTEETPCAIEKDTFIPCFMMYGSYFLLFLHFFIQRYVAKKTKSKTAPAKKTS